MWKIGNFEIDGNVVLAPMAGYTSFGYRKFMNQFGASVSFTEMVSDMGLIYDNKETNTYIDYPKDFLTGVQLFGSDPINMSKAAKIALKKNKNIDFFDVNMGCPVNKVTKSGAGSALLKNPSLCGEIVKAIKESTKKPVTAKIRLGWDNNSINFLDVIKSLEEAGVDAIAIHARTKKDLYAGEPNFIVLKNLGEQMKVPLIISGNIYTLDDAINAINITKASAVMVARGGVGNPWLIKQIDEYYRNGTRLPNASVEQNINYCIQLADELIKEKGENAAMRIYRCMAPKFFSGIKNAKSIKARLACKLVDRKSLIDILEDIRGDLSN